MSEVIGKGVVHGVSDHPDGSSTIEVEFEAENWMLFARAIIHENCGPTSRTIWDEYDNLVRANPTEFNIQKMHETIGSAMVNQFIEDALRAAMIEQEAKSNGDEVDSTETES